MGRSVIDIASEIQAIAQSGLSFSIDPFDKERFKQLVDVASTLVARHTTLDTFVYFKLDTISRIPACPSSKSKCLRSLIFETDILTQITTSNHLPSLFCQNQTTLNCAGLPLPRDSGCICAEARQTTLNYKISRGRFQMFNSLDLS